MASLYDEKVLGAKERIALARKLQEQGDNVAAGQMVSGWYVPNTGGAVLGALKNVLGAWEEKGAKEELDTAEREKYANIMRAQESMGIPASEEMAKMAGTPEQQPSIWSRIKAGVTFEDQPKATPAQPMAHNVAQNVTPEQQETGLINLMQSSPEMATSIMTLQKLRQDQAKALREQKMEKVPSGFLPTETEGQIKPMIMPNGTTYDQFLIQQQAGKENIVSPVEQASMANQQAHLGIAQQNAALAQQNNALQQQKYINELQRQTKQDEEKKFKDIPQKQIDAQTENFSAIKKIDDAIKSIQENPGALGAQNYLGTTIQQIADKKGIGTRAQVSEIGQTKINDISGAGVPLSERPIFAPFIPSVTDGADAAIKKLQVQKQNIQRIEDERLKSYSPEQGYKPNLRTYEPPQPKQPESNLPSQDAIQAEMRRRGLIK